MSGHDSEGLEEVPFDPLEEIRLAREGKLKISRVRREGRNGGHMATYLYRCTRCKKDTQREELVSKIALFRKLGAKGKSIRARTVDWLCPDCLNADDDFNSPQWGQRTPSLTMPKVRVSDVTNQPKKVEPFTRPPA